MAVITGTLDADRLVGTADDDIIFGYGVSSISDRDVLIGGAGNDQYNLAELIGSNPVHRYLIDDRGTDGGVDEIVGAGGLVQSASLGYRGFATAVHQGNNLVIVTPGKPARFHEPGSPPYEITIRNHYDGAPVEWLTAGGVTYALPTGSAGTVGADIMAGTNGDDIFSADSGDDFVTGNSGHDILDSGAGNDHVFGGRGRDTVFAGEGDDWVFGEDGADTVDGGGGHDWLELGLGADVAHGGEGNDHLFGMGGNDTLFGGDGSDTLTGGDGDDRLIGGRGGDTYRIGYDLETLGTVPTSGHDVIVEKGDAATWAEYDRIEFFGYYGPNSGSSAEAYARLSFSRSGNDMIITSDGGLSSVRVQDQFRAGTERFHIEEIELNGGYWTPIRFRILDGGRDDIGDDRSYPLGLGGELNEVIFGTDGDDTVFSDSGSNFIWLGGGADVLLYKESDPGLLYGQGGGSVNDIVMDFDPSQDRFDFTEIAGIDYSSLTISTSSDSDAIISWDSGSIEVSDIHIELRGVAAGLITPDLFDFA